LINLLCLVVKKLTQNVKKIFCACPDIDDYEIEQADMIRKQRRKTKKSLQKKQL